MKIINGTGVSEGYAKGPVIYHQNQEQVIERAPAEDPEAQVERFLSAKEQAKEQLDQLYLEALELVGEQEAGIFKMHKMLLDDEEFTEAVTNHIQSEQVAAQYGVQQAAEELMEVFRSLDNDYMKERAADIQDISRRVIEILIGAKSQAEIQQKGILFAEDLTPSETIRMDKQKIMAIVTEKGSAISHSAILARTLGIPAVVGVVGLLTERTDGTIIVDGTEGIIIIAPDGQTDAVYEQRMVDSLAHKQRLEQLIGTPAVSADGCKIELACNIGNPEDVSSVLSNDGESIGLFRSEFLYMDSSDFPTEEEQYTAYQKVLSSMKGRRVIVRTLDLGADKHVPYFDLGEEENPAMGYRAIRICLRQKEIFRTQLRALLRASVHGRLGIMFPMIAALKELQEARQYLTEIKAELKQEGIAYSDQIEVGMMIETPAAVMISDLLAREVDFFSIGTNDLTQYTLAADRMNSNIADFYNPRSKAVLRMIKMTADHAHRAGKWVGICGESAADEELLRFYLAVGIDELSVAPGAVLPLKELLQTIDVGACREAEYKKWL